MELIMTIAILCQVSAGKEVPLLGYLHNKIDKDQLQCQQSYIHCVNTKSTTKPESLELSIDTMDI